MLKLLSEQEDLLYCLRRVQHRVRQAVLTACQSLSSAQLRGEAVPRAGDTTYAIDRIAEESLLSALEEEMSGHLPLVLVCEGLEGGEQVLPSGADESNTKWRILVDPIDGTRGLMVQKRSAWILTGAAPNRGRETSLADVQVAVQTELPLNKQHLADELWAIAGKGTGAERWNRFTEESQPLVLQPSPATDLIHGYGTVCSFFAGARDVLGGIADELSRGLLGEHQEGEARIFEDQYACTGGQLAGLILGQDRFVADLRPLLVKVVRERGDTLGHCCHPYDLATMLIATEAGVAICDPQGNPINVPLDTETNVAWVGYANQTLRERIAPVLQAILEKRGLIQRI